MLPTCLAMDVNKNRIKMRVIVPLTMCIKCMTKWTRECKVDMNNGSKSVNNRRRRRKLIRLHATE